MHQGRSALLHRLRRFGRDASGASALEFAIVATPFILLLLVTLEVGAIYFANYSLENAASVGARMLRTGQAQSKKFDAAQFQSEVCKHLTAPLSCAKLKLDVRRFENFGSTDMTQPLDATGNLKTNFTYDPGVGGDVVVVRAFYPLDLPASLPLDIRMSNMKDGNRLLVATVAFRNEPFQLTGTTQ
jgi:Flp pilus assembly protein TadG